MDFLAGLLANDQWAGYVAAVYGISAVALGGAVLITLLAWYRAKARLAALEKRP